MVEKLCIQLKENLNYFLHFQLNFIYKFQICCAMTQIDIIPDSHCVILVT
jgi:hypothetical protein